MSDALRALLAKVEAGAVEYQEAGRIALGILGARASVYDQKLVFDIVRAPTGERLFDLVNQIFGTTHDRATVAVLLKALIAIEEAPK